MTQNAPTPPREPIFNISERAPVVLGAVFIAVHVVATYGPLFLQNIIAMWGLLMSPDMAAQINDLPAGRAYTSLILHGFLHGSWAHALVNTAMMVPFGVVTIKGAKLRAAQKGRSARGEGTFLFVFFAGVIIGGAGQLLYWKISGEPGSALGASGGVSALFACGAWAMGGRPQLLKFAGAWLLINIVMIFAGEVMTGGAGVAWASHLAGFAAGAVLGPLLVRANSTGFRAVQN
ncbi:MAG: rhomboid family intramembrane serine protease [Maricaulaceae bacterium]